MGTMLAILLILVFPFAATAAQSDAVGNQRPAIYNSPITSAPYNADGTGKMDCTPVIERIKKDQQNQGMIYFPRGTYLIANSVDIPRGMGLGFEPGAKLLIAAGQTLTINGAIEAGLWQIFAPAQGGRVEFSKGCVKDVYPQWWGALNDGVADDYLALQAALNTRCNVSLPKGIYYTGTATVKSYPNQIVTGAGWSDTIIKSQAAVGFAIADADGDINITTKGLTFHAFLRDLRIIADAPNATGLQFAGVLYGGLQHVWVGRSADEIPGKRTGYGIIIMGLDKAKNRGCYYNELTNVSVQYFAKGIVMGARTHQNGPLLNPLVSYCDTGFIDDDGAMFGFKPENLSWGGQQIVIGGAFEAIQENAFDIRRNSGITILQSPYIDGVNGNGINVNARGGQVVVVKPYFSSIKGVKINHVIGVLNVT
jgi:hypothetical protein